MKPKYIKDIKNSTVLEEREAAFEVSANEAGILRRAQRLLDGYKNEAFRALKKKEGDSEWCEVSYTVLDDAVVVNVRKGSIG